jgi:hypothetical protein
MIGSRTTSSRSVLYTRRQSARLLRRNYTTGSSGTRSLVKGRANNSKNQLPTKPKRSVVSLPSLPKQRKSRTLPRDMVQHHRPRKRRQLQTKRLVMSVVLIAIMAGGALVSYEGWQANRAVQAQALKLTHDANVADVAANHGAASQSAGSNPAPATNAPSADDLAAYVVAPTMPRYLVIPKLGVKARVRQLGLATDGAIATPANIYDTGWYTGSALPGTPGASLIDGHISSWTAKGVFYGLNNLQPGDQLQIVRGSGQIITYTVVKKQNYADTNTDMSTALSPAVAGTPGLNLISCYGKVKPGTNEFDQRIVVFTKQVM